MVRLTRGPALQVDDLLGKALGGAVGVGVQQLRGAHVGTGRTAHAEVDAPRRQRLEHAELLGHLERRVMRQHDAGTAQAHALRARGDGRQQDLGRGADDGRQAVVLADPEAVVAQGLAMRGQIQRVAQRVVLTAPGAGDRLVQNRKRQCHAASVPQESRR